MAQPNLTFSAGYVMFAGEDQYGMTKTWPNPGNQQEDAMGYFAASTGLHLKAGLGWEITDYFSAGLAFQMMNVSSAENFRTADITSLGVQIRVNFSNSQNKLVPFFQGAYYFSNAQSYEQKSATNAAGTQTQPAFTVSGNTSTFFNADFGLEYKLSKSMGLQFTAGFNGLQPIDEVPAGASYSPYAQPLHFGGGFSVTLAGGIKYYFGRGSKQRDF